MKNCIALWTSVLSASGLFVATPVEAGNAPVWLDAYGASPASYSLPDDVPAQMKPMVQPKVVQGTVRQAILIAAGGRKLAIRVSNEEGQDAMVIGAASVAMADPVTGAPAGPLIPLKFSGMSTVIVPKGTPLVSDPVDLPTKPFDRLVVSLYSPAGFKMVALGGGLFPVAPGDQTRNSELTDASTVAGRPLVSGAVILSDGKIPIVVTMGDSITDGVRPNALALAGYPEVLARRLAKLPARDRRVVVNSAIAGNRLLSPGWGDSALERFDRDVLRFGAVSHLLLLEGINDIGMAGPPLTKLEPSVTAEALIAGYRQIVHRARARGIRVIGGTLTPFAGAFYVTPEKEAVRSAVNQWIRTSGEFDGFVDFDRILRDPAQPDRLKAEFDSGDHLHPNERGYREMGEQIDLALFR